MTEENGKPDAQDEEQSTAMEGVPGDETASADLSQEERDAAAQEVEKKFEELLGGYPVVKTVLRMEKVGRVSYLLAHVVVEPNLELRGIEELDELRRKIAAGIQEVHPSWIVDTVFVVDDSLAV